MRFAAVEALGLRTLDAVQKLGALAILASRIKWRGWYLTSIPQSRVLEARSKYGKNRPAGLGSPSDQSM